MGRRSHRTVCARASTEINKYQYTTATIVDAIDSTSGKFFLCNSSAKLYYDLEILAKYRRTSLIIYYLCMTAAEVDAIDDTSGRHA